MSGEKRLRVVLCWHMHQPQYRDLVRNEYQLPWTYLHAIKDYVDMAAHLEGAPAEARAVVNFAPVLLEQIADYAEQVQSFLHRGVAIRDPLLSALEHPTLPLSAEARLLLIKACLRANEQRLIHRYPAYRRLVDLARWILAHPDNLRYVQDAFLADLIVWYHLAWLGETVRRDDERAQALIEKGNAFTIHDRRVLLEVIGELLSGVIPRYRALAESGRVELSLTPYAHPMIPLLLDFDCVREAMPDAPLPLLARYPGGEARARTHIEQGKTVFKRYFGFIPVGCWPSEGGMSKAALRLLAEAGFRWAASGQSVLQNSLRASLPAPDAALPWPHQPWRVGDDKGITCFFRDDGLSDLIGFAYADWHGDDAVANLVHHLEQIAEGAPDASSTVVSIILDGENAWEYYPENGYYFLHRLYERLATHPRLELTTFSRCLDAIPAPSPLPRLVAGSWVYGTFSTWIGERDKNRGWDMLGEAKQAFDTVVASGRLSAEELAAAERQLAVCEGSDWFWWFGDYNPETTVHDFDLLFRLHLSNLYHLLGVEAPEYLAHAFSHGHGEPERGGVMRHGQVSK